MSTVLDRLQAVPRKMPTSWQSYTVGVVDRMSQFEDLAHEWELLMAAADNHDITLTHAWLATWIASFPPAKLFIITVRDARGTLVGAAPLQIDRPPVGFTRRLLRHVQYIGTEPCTSDRLGLLVAADHDAIAVIDEMSKALVANCKHWDVIDLRFNPSHAQHQLLAMAVSGRMTLRELHYSPMVIPSLTMPTTEPERKALAKRFGRDLNRMRNHVRRDFHGAEPTLSFPSPLETGFAKFIAQHRSFLAAQGSRSDFDRYPMLGSFYRRLYARLMARAPQGFVMQYSELKVGDQTLSYHIDFREGDRILGHLAVYDPAYKKYRPGVLHLERFLEHAQTLGIRRFEMGRGDQPYKVSLCDGEVKLWNWLAFKGPVPTLLWRAESLLKRALGKRSIHPW